MSPNKNTRGGHSQQEQDGLCCSTASLQRGCLSEFWSCRSKGKTLPTSVKVKGGKKLILKGALALVLILGLASMANALTCPKALRATFCPSGAGLCDTKNEGVWDSFLLGDFLYVGNFNYLMKINLLTKNIEWGRKTSNFISTALFV